MSDIRGTIRPLKKNCKRPCKKTGFTLPIYVRNLEKREIQMPKKTIFLFFILAAVFLSFLPAEAAPLSRPDYGLIYKEFRLAVVGELKRAGFSLSVGKTEER